MKQGNVYSSVRCLTVCLLPTRLLCFVEFFCQAWDYSLKREPLCRTQSLARIVNTLSTKVLADSLVSLNTAFFDEWLISCRTLLFVLLSSACLASSSQSLNRYVFYPNKHVHLASFSAPDSLACQVLSAFHNVPGQSFAFCIHDGNRTHYRLINSQKLYQMSYVANLPWCAVPVAPYLVRYRIQHTTCLSPCGILNDTSRIRSSVLLLRLYCYLAFPC